MQEDYSSQANRNTLIHSPLLPYFSYGSRASRYFDSSNGQLLLIIQNTENFLYIGFAVKSLRHFRSTEEEFCFIPLGKLETSKLNCFATWRTLWHPERRNTGTYSGINFIFSKIISFCRCDLNCEDLLESKIQQLELWIMLVSQ